MVVKVAINVKEGTKYNREGAYDIREGLTSRWIGGTPEELIKNLEEIRKGHGEGNFKIINNLLIGSEGYQIVSEWTKNPVDFLMKRADKVEGGYHLNSLLKGPSTKLADGAFISADGHYDLTISKYCNRSGKKVSGEKGKGGIEWLCDGGVRIEDMKKCYEDNQPCFFFACSLQGERIDSTGGQEKEE